MTQTFLPTCNICNEYLYYKGSYFFCFFNMGFSYNINDNDESYIVCDTCVEDSMKWIR